MKKIILLFVIIISQYIYSQGSPFIQNIVNQVNKDSLIFNLRQLSGDIPCSVNGQQVTIVSRHKNNAANELAAQYIYERLAYYGFSPSFQSFSTTGRNVLAVQPGTQFPNQKYIVCAHFDNMPSGSLAPGADDNGSGTIAVLEAARILKNYSFPFTIVYALWDEEEQGLVGSNYYATQAAAAGDSILGVFNMDMIAWDSNNDYKTDLHARGANSLQLAQKMFEINTMYNTGLTMALLNPGSTYSDHASFWSKGYGAILLIEEDNDFHQYYHTTNDKMQYINQEMFYRCAKLTIASLSTFAANLRIDILHTPLASGFYSGNITVNARVSSGLTIPSGMPAPKLYYRVKPFGGIYSGFTMTDGTVNQGSYNFTIPAQDLGSTVEYYLAAQDDAGSLIVTSPAGGSGFNPPGSTPPPSLYKFVISESVVAVQDSAHSMSNWTVTGTWGTTTSSFVSAPASITESPSGNYTANATMDLKYTGTITLPQSVLGASLEYDLKWDIEDNWDYAQIQISTNNGSTWTAVQGSYTNLASGTFQPPGQHLYDGTNTSWVHEVIDLVPYLGQTIKFRFYFRSDGSLQKDGIYLDNITVKQLTSTPVELAGFTAKSTDDGVLLSWQTGSELNNRGFAVERKLNNETWIQLSLINGKGTTAEPSSYAWLDNAPVAGMNEYRLKQYDYDGTMTVYGPVSVNYEPYMSYNLEQNYPNPFNPSTKIMFSIPEQEKVVLKVYDASGSMVQELINTVMEKGRHEVDFNASGLATGVYYYRLSSGDYTKVRSMILMK